MKNFQGRIIGAALLFSGCTSQHLPNNQTASDQFYRLGYHEKTIARNFYDMGQGDAVKRLYWSQRRAQETGYHADNGVRLQRKYAQIPVPENTQPDGTVQEAHQTVIEVVQ